MSSAGLKKSGWEKIYQDPAAYTFYDLHAPHEDLGAVTAVFQKHQVRTVLDVGCGLGNNLIYLAQRGFIVSGIDAAPTAVKTIKTEIKHRHLAVDVKLGYFQKLPFDSNSFDGLISIQTLCHGYAKDVLLGIAEITRVVKPGGIIFLTLPGRVAKGKVRYCLAKTARKVGSHTYVPALGEEIGEPHYLFNKVLIVKHFRRFQIFKFWKDSKDYYCFLAKKKP
jgi:SAM-dependent methyltransferase